MNKRPAVLLLLLALVSFLYAPPASAIEVSSTTLPNGLQLVVIPNNAAPVVSHMVWYKVGAIDEQKPHTGLAHFLEHLMFRGTQTLKPGEFSSIVAQLGGNDNAFTSYDFTAYHQTIASAHLERVMQLEADRMRGLIIDTDDAARELKVVMEEYNTRIANVPASHLNAKMIEAAYGTHPYGRQVIGYVEDLARLDKDSAREFYNNYYHPGNAIVVISGDVTPKAAKALATRYYGAVPAREVARPLPALPPLPEARTILHRDEKVQQPQWRRLYPAPSALYAPQEDCDALSVLAQILGSGEASRLQRLLVDEMGIATQTGAYYNDLTLGPSSFQISVTPAQGKKMDAIGSVIDQEIERVKVSGVDDRELQAAKVQLKAQVYFAQDGVEPLGNIVGELYSMGLNKSYLESWEERIEAISSEEIQRVANTYLLEQHAITGQLLAEEK